MRDPGKLASKVFPKLQQTKTADDTRVIGYGTEEGQESCTLALWLDGRLTDNRPGTTDSPATNCLARMVGLVVVVVGVSDGLQYHALCHAGGPCEVRCSATGMRRAFTGRDLTCQ
jgi:hypothetical protein